MDSILLPFLSIVCLCVISSTNAWIPMMINGRPRGGMVPAPEAPPGVPLPEENWFEFQKLDHFNGRDYRWWKQVCVLR